MRRAALRLAVSLAALQAWAACGADPPPAPPAAPVAPRAVLVLEPPRVAIGEVASIELSVVTPPGHRALPLEPPEAIPGFWLLDAEILEAEREPARWVHRTRLRVRAREVGRFAWPGGQVEVEAPDGSIASVDLDPLPLEVVSVRPEFPERSTPFGARAPPEPDARGSAAGAAAAGALAALAAVGLVWVVRRRLGRRSAPTDPRATPAEPPWIAARAALDAARADADDDPLAAAHATSAALRRYMARRFGADAEARTTEELESAAPPFAATSRWPAFVSILRQLDGFRFCPEGGDAQRRERAERLGDLLDQAQAFVEDTVPSEERW